MKKYILTAAVALIVAGVFSAAIIAQEGGERAAEGDRAGRFRQMRRQRAEAVKERLDKLIESLNLSEEKEAKVKEIRKELEKKGRLLEEGGIELKKAKLIADEMRELREELLKLNFKLSEISSLTAETQAENEELNFLISCCVFANGKPYFKSLDDYYQKVGDDPVATVASLQFQYMWYGLDNDVSSSFIENKFLKEFGFEKEEEVEVKERKPFLKNGKPVNAS